MKINKKDFNQLKKVAIELDKGLVGKVPHLVSVCIEPDEFSPNRLGLYVHIDNIIVKNLIPKNFQGHKVGVKVVGTPQFAQAF